MYQMQESELHVDQEQKDDDGAFGIQKILQAMPLAHAAQGNAVKQGPRGKGAEG